MRGAWLAGAIILAVLVLAGSLAVDLITGHAGAGEPMRQWLR